MLQLNVLADVATKCFVAGCCFLKLTHHEKCQNIKVKIKS